MSQTAYTEHYSVLKKECIEALTERAAAYVHCYLADLTFGGGGHTFALAKAAANITVFATDQDPDALKNGYMRIEREAMKGKIELLSSNFEFFPELLRQRYPQVISQGGLAGVLMDLGVSSHHFDQGSRGFSFRFDAPLDMRMNHQDDKTPTAAHLLNNLSCDQLEEILREYGEEIFAKQIVANIVKQRQLKPIETTGELEDIIFHSYPKKMRHDGISPSTKTFQALRIAVNRELAVLENTIGELFELLAPGGRLAIISFHSLEDRIVKQEYKKIADKYPFMCRILTKKPIIPTDQEIAENKRSRSAKLRIIEKIDFEMLTDKEKKKLKYQGLKDGSEA